MSCHLTGGISNTALRRAPDVRPKAVHTHISHLGGLNCCSSKQPRNNSPLSRTAPKWADGAVLFARYRTVHSTGICLTLMHVIHSAADLLWGHPAFIPLTTRRHIKTNNPAFVGTVPALQKPGEGEVCQEDPRLLLPLGDRKTPRTDTCTRQTAACTAWSALYAP